MVFKTRDTYIIFVMFMKKILASIIVITYIVFSCGVVINFHFCMDRLASTSLFGKESRYCGKCGMHSDDSNGCCRDEVKVVKLGPDQQKAHALMVDQPTPILLSHLTSVFISLPFENPDVARHFHNHSPPLLLSAQDTYLQNNVFRI